MLFALGDALIVLLQCLVFRGTFTAIIVKVVNSAIHGAHLCKLFDCCSEVAVFFSGISTWMRHVGISTLYSKALMELMLLFLLI